ncbi:hypothetical protein O0880_14375 [Janthinobacterium sp. SUN118]|uniref:hypothetical protein n=1 Tax=Janthinobacterium sp. SUN118 TaxID=3004100 RepID=UPI0025B25343|nr:hypothetical protein [Janthinobacterium sp. SUN118]MDN2710608.1 hypothetical protein [Janthinobacterium sp. SUN118]
MGKDQNNIWYLAGPMFQYNEDVKALARQAGLKIVDSTVAVDRVNAAEDVPEVTIKAEYAERAMPTNGDHAPTAADLLSARADLLAASDLLLERERALDEREQRLVEAKERIEALGAANEIEAQRLRNEAASLQAAKDAAAAVTVSTAPPPAATATSTDKPTKAAKA